LSDPTPTDPPIRGHARAGSSWRVELAQWDERLASGPVSLQAAQVLAAHGAYRAAVEVYGELLEREPERGDLWQGLASLHRRLGEHETAAGCVARAHSIELDGIPFAGTEATEAATFLLAAEGYADAPSVVPASLVTAHFDERATTFERQLIGQLGYCGPADLYHFVLESGMAPAPKRLDVLDLGCGTGLAGVQFRGLARRMVGVDLSGAMLDEARAKDVYDHLERKELVDYLESGSSAEDGYDLILAADVFNYLGDLQPVFGACAARLRGRGTLAFTVEATEAEKSPQLSAQRRFQHGRAYLERSLGAAGFEEPVVRAATLRYEHDTPVAAFLCLARVGPCEDGAPGDRARS